MKRFTVIVTVWLAAMLFSGCQNSKHTEKTTKTEEGKVKHALVIALDASAENYACAKLKEANLDEIKRRYLNADYVKDNGIDAIYTVVFSRDTEFVASIAKSDLPKMRDIVKQRKFVALGKKALRMAIEKMSVYHSYKDSNNQVKHYGRDVVGAIVKIVRALQNDKSAEKATIILASDMLQSVNKAKTKALLEKKPIVLPDTYRIEALAKAYVCEKRWSALQIERHILHNQEVWKRFVKPSENVRFYYSY